MSETLRADAKEQATQTRVMLCALYFFAKSHSQKQRAACREFVLVVDNEKQQPVVGFKIRLVFCQAVDY